MGGADAEAVLEVVVVEAAVEEAEEIVELGGFEARTVGAGLADLLLPLRERGRMVVEAADDLFGMRADEGGGAADGGGLAVGDADPAEAERLVGAVDVEALGEAVGPGGCSASCGGVPARGINRPSSSAANAGRHRVSGESLPAG